jgi:small nuclear ribonucleoprotein E
MNLVVDDAVEVRLATKSEEEKRRSLGILSTTQLNILSDLLTRTAGQILLKGDNVSLIQAVQ